jgi:hypothetical protein
LWSFFIERRALSSGALPFGGLWYLEVRDAVNYTKFYSRSHPVVIRVYDAAGNVIKNPRAQKAILKNRISAQAWRTSRSERGKRRRAHGSETANENLSPGRCLFHVRVKDRLPISLLFFHHRIVIRR